jgi:DME family drug/metabolite transporter
MGRYKGFILIMAAGLCWSLTGLFGTFLFRSGISPLLVASVRVFITAILFFIFLFCKYRFRFFIPSRDLALFAVFGWICVGLFNYFYLQAINTLGISLAVILLYTSPAFVIVLSAYFLGEAVTPLKIAVLLLTLLGVFGAVGGVASLQFQQPVGGLLTGLGAGFTFSLLTIFSKYALKKYDHLIVVFYLTFFGALFLAFLEPPWLIWRYNLDVYAFLSLFALILISTFLGYLFFVYGLKYLKAGKASIILTIEPLSAIFWAALFFKEKLRPCQFTGAALIIAAIILQNIRDVNGE